MEKVILLICLLWLSINIHAKGANDSLKAGDTLNISSTPILVSKQGMFYLQAMTFDNGNTYLTIGSDNYGRVWVSNTNQPIDPNSTILSLNHSGVLKIESQKTKLVIILYSPLQPIANNNYTVATLLDTGNFVLQQFHPNGTKSTLLWQSFDYPGRTLLPGMKLGINRKTGHNWSIVSWITKEIPTPGTFSFEWEPETRELVIKLRGKVLWKSGKLRNNGTIFENIPEDVQHVVQYTIISNTDEDSFTLKFKTPDDDGNFLNGWFLAPNGRLLNISSGFLADGIIAKADMCFGFNNNSTSEPGCQKWDELTCKEPGDMFEKTFGDPMSYEDAYYANTSYGYSDCKMFCWKYCNCTGFRLLYDNETGCTFFGANSTKDITEYEDGDRYFYALKRVKVAPSQGTLSKKKILFAGKKKWIWISALIVALLLILCLCLAIKKLKHGLKEKKTQRRETKMLDLTAANESSIIRDLEDDLKGHDIKVFDYASILAATADFSQENKLGQGGYGPVYKGILPSGQEVAVKRLAKTSGQGIVEFKNELTLICELQHTNLVQLLGCCIQEDERILIYEYMSNKSLDFYLFDCTKRKLLDWKVRFNIIEGISQGILYLHKYSRLKIIHRDLKASNILLDENMNPKISDFGMARMFTQQESTVNTNRIVGTYGYMSPEYAMEGVFSTKSDVYSFGVLLLEMVSGRRNNSFYTEDKPQTLISYAWELWKENESLQLMDPSLKDTFIFEEVQRCIHVSLLCVEHYPNDRPTMSNVISMLTSKHEVVILPKRPAFYVEKEIDEGTTTSKVSGTDFTKEYSTSSEEEQG